MPRQREPREGRRRILLAAFHFPPGGWGGVQRASKLVKYLPDHGWEAVVLAGDPADLPVLDADLLADVPPSTVVLRRRLPRVPGIGDPGLRWIPWLLRDGTRGVRRFGAEAVLLTGSPFLSFLAGPLLRHRTGVPYVLDFRDPWCVEPWDPRGAGWKAAAKEGLSRFIEAAAVRRAAACTFASPGVRCRYLAVYPELREEWAEAIPNGYDEEDFPDAGKLPPPPPGRPRLLLVHTGSWAGFRTPELLLQGLARFRSRHPDLAPLVEARLVGLAHGEWQAMAEGMGLGGAVRFDPYQPHGRCLEILREADLLWLDNGPSPCYVSGKMFEYMASGRPIVAAAHPDGEAGRWLRECGTATLVPRDPEGIAEALAEVARRILQGWRPAPVAEAVRRFGRRRLAGRFAALLERAAGES